MTGSARLAGLVAALALALVGCAGSLAIPGGPDANAGCNVFLTFDPPTPIAGPANMVRAISNVTGLNGLPEFLWHVTRADTGADVPFTDAQFDHSQIQFDIPAPGTIDVRLDLTAAELCPSAVAHVNVLPPNATGHSYRLRIRANGAPPQEQNIDIPSGTPTYDFGPYGLSPGKMISPVVKAAGVGVPAYVRLAPTSAPDEIVETFSSATGAFSARILDATHTVIVVPAASGLAPRKFTTDFSTTTQLDLDAGTAVSGVVKGPSGAGLAGAKVQLMIDDLPSTLATTAADGSFTVRAVPDPLATISVDVTPPVASGLPRLAASGALDLTKPMSITYATTLSPRDLAGTRILRAGAPVPNAHVTLVGTASAVGTVTTGSASAAATGTIHVAATADGAGVLPSLATVPVMLSAVIQVAGDDVAVATLNLGAGVPATITAPATVTAGSIIGDAHGPLAGVIVDIAPADALALAGLQPLRAISDAGGHISAQLAAGGHYDFRFQDPSDRVAWSTIAGVASETVQAMFTLAPATIVTGDVSVNGAGAAPSALVQVLCKTCGGVDRTRPVAEVTTDGAGAYHYAVENVP